MKSKILALAVLLLFSHQVDAQIFKKIKEKVTDVVTGDEETDTEETEEEQESETSLGLFGMGDFNNLDEVPEVYRFNWEYELEITDHKGRTSSITYLLPENENYFGFTQTDKGNTIQFVYDLNISSSVMFTDDGENKTIMSIKLPNQVFSIDDETYTQEDLEGKITEIESEVILGKTCKGYKYEDDEIISKYWIDENSPVSFYNVFANQKGMNVNEEWAKMVGTGLIMKMEYTSKSKKKENMTMLCKRVDQNMLQINKADYNSYLDY